MAFLCRSRHFRQTSWSSVDIASVDKMSIANSETSTSSRRRDTGFPETFCGSESCRSSAHGRRLLIRCSDRNTSLPHPDADTSPNACIFQEDISVARVTARQRRSFLARNKKATSHGFLTPGMYSGGDSSVMISASETSVGGGHAMNRPVSGSGDSFASLSTGDLHEDAAPDSPSQHQPRSHRHSRMQSIDSSASSTRKRSFMQKLGIHRHHD